MTLSFYLGRGQMGHGRTTISQNMQIIASTLSYRNVGDLATIAIKIDHTTINLPENGTQGQIFLLLKAAFLFLFLSST